MMRIGRFGEINGLSIDTIRHYMDLGLIVPEKKGGQYFFDDYCQKDLNFIMEFKRMGFSLNEIKIIFHYINLGKFTNYEEDAYYQSLFRDKLVKVEQEIKYLGEMKERLKSKLEVISNRSVVPNLRMGIDLKVLDMLKCPKCGEQFTLQDGIINRNQIMEGKLICDCGADYSIESGVLNIVIPSEPTDTVLFENNIPEYIHETDPIYLENLQKEFQWTKRRFSQVDLHNKVLLELGTGLGFFLRNIYQDLPEDCLYIAVDRSLERHLFLKSFLERTGSKKKVIFVCADFRDIPIKEHSVDVLIDLSGTSNYSFEHEDFLLCEIDPLVKSNGDLLGAYLGFEKFSHKGKIKAQYRDNFTISKIRQKLIAINYQLLEERISEPIDKGGRYEDFFVEGEKIVFYSVFAKR